jgi:hypothetical protein
MKALYNTQTQKLLPWPRIDDEPVVGLAAHLLEMDVMQEPQPAFDPATQRLEKTEVIDTDTRTVTRGWNVVEVPVATMTAEEAVSQYFSAYQIAALQELRMALMQAGQPLGPKMTAAKNWLESVMLGWALDPTEKPQSDFGAPSGGVTFEQASAEAVADLSSPNPET